MRHKTIRKLLSLFLAVIMVLGTTQDIFAMNLMDDFGFDNIMPASITPSGEKRHEFRFYASEEEAKAAQAAQAGNETTDPFDIEFVRTDGILEVKELVEQKDELFAGWNYTENGVEQAVPFGKQSWIDQDKTFYAYPKRNKVIAVFFSHGSVVYKSVSPDAEGKVSINDQQGVGEAGKALRGWSIGEKFNTVAEAEKAGKLFHFKEDEDPTIVKGTLMLYAIFEDAVRVSFDTHGSIVIPGMDVEAGESVKVPDTQDRLEKEGYTFEHWYVLEEDEDSPDGQKEVELTTTKKEGVDYFNYTFNKDTIIHAKWKGQEVPFHVIFMAEKRPDQIKLGGEKYSFLGSFQNLDNPSLQITKGIAGSQIIFDNEDGTAPLTKITSLNKDQFKSYLEEPNKSNNLFKYANLMGITNLELLKGFHVNKEETNKKKPVIEGNGLTTKVIYLDRDTVNLRVYKGGKFVDTEATNQNALGNFKYGQILLENDENRGWKYLFNKYIKIGNTWRWLGNYEGRTFFSVPPFAVEQVKGFPYMKRNEAKTAWIFDFHDSSTMGGPYTILSVPLKLPVDKQDATYDQAKAWIKAADVETLKNQLLPNKETPLIGKMGGMPDWMYVEAVDYALIDGYETINTTIPGDPNAKPNGRPDGCTPSLKENDSIIKLKEVAGITDNSKYLVMPIIYKKQKFDLRFNSYEKGELESTTIKEIPYYSTIVNSIASDEGDPNLPDKERQVKEYLEKFIPAEVDPDTKEVINLEQVTKNSKNHLFMGWYLDPGFNIPFDKHMPMPAQNLQVFAKWEPLYHYITVHHLPAGVNGVNKPQNITELKVGHGELINTQEDILKNPPILSGRARSDFQGWETYGDIKKEEPSISGVDGGPFVYKFDKPVLHGFHLYPRWYINKVGVVYAFNYNESNRPLEESEQEIENIMENIDKAAGPITIKDRFYMSEYKYPLDAKVRLRAPLGWEDSGKVIEPAAPQGTKAYGKVFLGWKVMYRDKSYPFAWHTIDDLVYYNSEIEFSENKISHKSGAKRGDAVGVMVLVAQWGEKKINTNITLHRNFDAKDKTIKEYKIENVNQDWRLPDLEDSNDLADLSSFAREKYQFLGWSEKPDGSGKVYKPGDSIYVDETHDIHLNHLYAQWEKYYTLEAEKKWSPEKKDYDFKLGLLRWTAPSGTANPDFTTTSGFMPVLDSLKSYKTDLEADGKMKWEVPGLDEHGKRYSYVLVEIKLGMEDTFKNFTAWNQLNVVIDKTLKSKTQTIALTDTNSKIDTFTSATVRSSKRNDDGKIAGYDFIITNEKIVVAKPIITQPYADQNVIVITPGKDSDKAVEKAEKIVVTLLNGNETLELTKDEKGNFTVSNNNNYSVTADASGKITITLPAGTVLEKNQEIIAVAKNASDVSSEPDSKTVLDAQDSFKIEKPVQEKRDEDYNVVIKANLPADATVVKGTTFTLTDEKGNPIQTTNNQPITATPDSSGKLTFNVPDGILKDGQKVKVQTKEPSKNATFSDLSDALDINAPEITAKDISGKVGVNLVIDENQVIVTDKDLNGLEFKAETLPAGLSLQKKSTEPNEPNTNRWVVLGAGKYVISNDDGYQVTYTATDRFGNKATKTIQVIITDKDVVDTPVIDDVSKGDSSVKITPPANGDTLVVTFPNNKKVTLTKNSEGNWEDTETNKVYKVKNGKIDVPVPNGKKLNVGDIVTAQGKDSTGTLADSKEAKKSVGQSTKKTPTPQFKKITVGDKNFKIKPVDQPTDSIITDKLVITIRNEKGKEEKKITLTKTDAGWVIKDSDGSVKYNPDQDGYITIALEGVTLTAQHSFGATGEDTFHGHAISDPTSINVNAEQSEKPTAEQGKNKENGNPTITGKGEPGADISVYNPSGELIAGPVKVDKDGNYEIEVPKDSVPENGVVDVKQKEDGKPESNATQVTIDTTAPDAPVIDQPNIGDTEIKVTPSDGAEKMTITLPDGSKVELTKKGNTTWTDGKKDFSMEEGKIILPTEPLKNNDIIKATAADKYDNTSNEAKKIVGNESSFATEKPVQKPRNDKEDVVIESKIPEGSNPADGTTYTLVDDDGNPIQTTNNQPITATPDSSGKLTFNVPDGILTDGQKVKVQTKEPSKNATLSDPSNPLDLTGPEITASDITGKVGVAIEEATISTDEAADITVSPSLPNNLVLGDADQTKQEWKINGKGEYVTTTTHTVIAVDQFGNKAEKKFTVTITNKDVVDTPVIDDVSKGDSSVKITPPTKGDTLVVTFPGNEEVTLTKDDDGNWKDTETNKVYKVKNGKIDVPVPNGKKLNVGDIVTAQGKDSTGTLADSNKALKFVYNYPVTPPFNNGGGSGSAPKCDETEPVGKLNYVDHFAYVQGYPDGSVRPNGLLTRAEVAAIFFRLLDSKYREEIRTTKNNFTDMNQAKWAIKHVSSLTNGRILQGYPDGSFRPNGNITRAELAAIASRFDKLELNAKHNFTDLNGHWAEKYIASATKKGWIDRKTSGEFKPDEYITRAEFVYFVNNVLDRHVKVENILPTSRQFTDLTNSNEWYYTAMKIATNSYLYEAEKNESLEGNNSNVPVGTVETITKAYQKWVEIIYPKIEM